MCYYKSICSKKVYKILHILVKKSGITELPLAVIGAAVLFLPRLMRWAMRIDTGAAFDTFGKNEHLRKIFWTLFIALAGLVLARIVDPTTAQQVIGALTGM
jgi:hypothetical protein